MGPLEAAAGAAIQKGVQLSDHLLRQ